MIYFRNDDDTEHAKLISNTLKIGANSTAFIHVGTFGTLLTIGYVGNIGSVCLISVRDTTSVATKDVYSGLTTWSNTRFRVTIYGDNFEYVNDNTMSAIITYVVGGSMVY